MNIHNTDKPINGYVAMYNGKQTDIYAETLYAAKQKAIAHFKPKKSQQHMVIVMLAEKPDGTQVIHKPLF